MTEEQRAAESQEETGSEAQVAENDSQQDDSQADESSQSSPAEGADMVPKAELTKKNKEAESLRKRLRQFEKQEEEKRKAQLSETEALQEENGTLKQKVESLQSRVRRATFENQLGLPDADLAWGMLQDLGLEVEWSENDAPTNIDDIRKRLKKEKPRIWGNGSANGGERTAPPPPSGSSFVDGLFRQGRTGTRR